MSKQFLLYWCEDFNDPDWELWDEFLQETPRGHYLQLSDWLKAYSVYGLNPALLLGKTNEGIIFGGLGIVKAGVSFLKMFIAPAGPIIREGWENYTEKFIEEFINYARKCKATYAHINVPILKFGDMPFSLPNSSLSNSSIFYTGIEGIRFKNVATISGLRWVDLSGFNSNKIDELLDSMPTKTRRDIRASQRKNVDFHECFEFDKVKEAYHSIEIFSQENGYVVRKWDDVSRLILESFNKGYSRFLVSRKENELKGAIWLIKCGKRLTYMTGGTKRESPDLLIGYLLQWNALKISVEGRYLGYDISLGGSPGVIKFKDGFNPVTYTFISPRYWIFNKYQFEIFQFLYPIANKSKTSIALLLKILKKYFL